MSEFQSAYIKTYRSGLLHKKVSEMKETLDSCMLCPRKCGINRFEETGTCKTSHKALISSYGPHFGEEAPLVGRYGSGTIFFTGCNLLCNFCQNYDISHEMHGLEISSNKLAEIMLLLQNKGCGNINLVTPSHVVPQILEALLFAVPKGLYIPLVYNTSSYDSLETIQVLSGIVDIYMPDLKFLSKESSSLTCNAPDYFENAKIVIKEMYDQCGKLKLNSNGDAISGLIIRHLIMPNDFSNSKELIDFIANEISTDTYVNFMPQYRPDGSAHEISQISRRINQKEFDDVISYAKEIGFTNFL
jgi:putative pyruvate formate lyase activating enzyme